MTRQQRYQQRNRQKLSSDAKKRYWANHEESLARIRSRSSYYKEWASKNADRRLQSIQAYRQRNREQLKIADHERYERNRAEVIARAKQWAQENKDRVKDNLKRWQKEHPERVAELRQASQERHPETKRTAVRRRRARLNGSQGNHTAADIAALYKIQNGRCAGCRKPLRQNYEVDHVMPISKGGSNGPENLELLCALCNRKKHNMTPDEWAARLGKLFV